MPMGTRLNISLGGILAGYTIALLTASPLLSAAMASAPMYENAAASQLLPEKSDKGDGGKGGGNGNGSKGGSSDGDGGDSAGGSTGGEDTGGQDSDAPAAGNVSSSPPEETIEAQVKVSPEDLELADSYPEDTFPDSYFLDKPMKKLQLQRYVVIDEDDRVVSSVRTGDDVEIVLGFKNIQQKEQVYVLITQIVDQEGVTQDIGWSVDVVESGRYIDWFKLWRPDKPGVCTIKVMMWDGMGENPEPLSELTAMTIVVQNSSP